MITARIYYQHLYLCVVVFCAVSFSIHAQLVINEFSSKNEMGILDEDGDYSDWIELYNTGTTTITLEGFTLSDNDADPTKWTFPMVSIEPQEHLLVFASGKDKVTTELHTNFSIQASGEPLLLSDNFGNLLDLVLPQALSPDQTYGRISDGAANWSFFLNGGTPDYANNGSQAQQSIAFSHGSGRFATAFDLSLFVNGGATIHYTTDGTIPSTEHPIYSGPIEIASRVGDSNVLCNIVCVKPEDFVPPAEEIFKINTIRACAFVNGEAVSKVYTKSYLVDSNPNRYTLPIISLVTDPDNFFDDEIGIYVPGNGYNGISESTMNSFQEGEEWERPVHFEFIDTTGFVLAQEAGVRIHGGGSRRKMHKALRLYARSEYGNSHFEHPFFKDRKVDKFKRLVLRAQQGSNVTFMTDEVSSNLAREMKVERMATVPTVVFLNGEFWGIYHLRERIDEHFFAEHYNINKDSVIILENEPETGCCLNNENIDYLFLRDSILNMDMTQPEAYEFAESQMDVDEFLNYLILQFYIANYDWPGNNLKYWKSNEHDGKWRWIFFDADFALRLESRPTLPNFMHNLENNTPVWGTLLAQQLFQNPQILDRFINLFEYHLNTTFTPENISCHHRQYAELLDAQMAENLDRFYPAFDYEYWQGRIDDLVEDFASLRPCFLQEQILEEFGVLIDVPHADCPNLDEFFNECPVEDLAFPAIFEVDLKVLLEGPYNESTTVMDNDLLTARLLPKVQPYNVAPWYYDGNENIGHLSSLPDDAVDWVLVEARTGTPSFLAQDLNMQVVETQAAILLADGNIVDSNTGQDLLFRHLTPNESYYFVIRHRNHLDILSAESVMAQGEMEYDFRDDQTQAFGPQQLKILNDGSVVMFAADITCDGLIQITDYDEWYLNTAVLNTYEFPDVNLDGVIQVTDYDKWFENKAKVGVPDIQYP